MTKRLFGGAKQRHAQMQEMEEAERATKASPSNLAKMLVDNWAWGTMSAPLVQAIALAACQDGLENEEVKKLSKVGGQGKYPGNMHRDLVNLSGKPQLSSAISPYFLKLKVSKVVSRDMAVDFLLPHKLFSCICHNLPSAFQTSLLGGTATRIQQFWTEMKAHPIVLARPQLARRKDLHQVIPIGIHGDGVSYMQAHTAGGKTLEVLSWASLLAQGPTKMSSFLMLLIVKSVVKESGFDQTWVKAWKRLSMTVLTSQMRRAWTMCRRGGHWQMVLLQWYLC